MRKDKTKMFQFRKENNIIDALFVIYLLLKVLNAIEEVDSPEDNDKREIDLPVTTPGVYKVNNRTIDWISFKNYMLINRRNISRL